MAALRKGLGLGLTAATAALFLSSSGDAQTVPTDAQPACPISPATFAAMFESGSVTLNGVVKPADSTAVLAPNCGFFVWTEQMFLWLTSPAPSKYGGGSRIMFSPTFFTVTPGFEQGGVERRKFLPNVPGKPLVMGLRTTELGPHHLPAVLTRTGQVVEVARTSPNTPVPPVVRLANGRMVRLSSVKLAPRGQLQFFDSSNRAVQVRKLALPTLKRTMVRMENGKTAAVVNVAAVKDAIRGRKFVLNGIPIFIDSNNNVIDVEPGQADGGVLLSQGGSLIYYISTVNDVFAYYRTMQGAAVTPNPTTLKFPLTAAQVAPVVTFAASHGHTIVDPEALAIETKSSWVEASAVSNPSQYITVDATIPTYDKSNPNMWVPNGQKTVKVAMVGLHVVGSTNGHGEMVWGSFEHLGNAPNATYQYNSTSGLKTVTQNTSGSWLFTPSGSIGPFNGMTASWDTSTGNLVSTAPPAPISATPVLRMRPWGTGGLDASLNTQVISANSAVITQLISGDVRANYFQLGSTWTIGGAPPNNSNQVGTNQLANATIETFMQAASPTTGTGSNCFTCHGTNTVQVSHIFGMLLPLF